MQRAYPHPATPLDSALFLAQAQRFREIDVTGLDAGDRAHLAAVLRMHLRATRIRAFRAHAAGVSLAVVSFGAGLALMLIGPAQAVGQLQPRVGELDTFVATGLLWAGLILLLIGGAVSADYVLRRRFRIARSWSHHADTLRGLIRRVEATSGG